MLPNRTVRPFVMAGNTDWSSSAGASDANSSEWLVYDVNTYIYVALI